MQYFCQVLNTSDYGDSGGASTLKTVAMISKFMEGVKNLVVKKHNLPITKIVDELMEVNTVSENEYYTPIHTY